MTPKEHIDRADRYLERAAAMSTRHGVCVENIPACNVLAALALAHATTAQAQLMESAAFKSAASHIPDWSVQVP